MPTPLAFPTRPSRPRYDVVIVGGAIMGSAAAWFLTDQADFDGTVLVVEKDPSYAKCSTAHTNSCMRQQFSREINVRVSQFAADFVKNLRRYMGDDPRIPPMHIHNFGYMYLADTEGFADALRAAQAVQAAAGAGTRLMTPDEIKAAYPFYETDDLVLGSHNTVDEGYFDGGGLFDWWRRQARERGVDYIAAEVAGLTRQGDRITEVVLADGQRIGCGTVVNAAGPRAARVAAMAGLDLPVEPRKRFTWVFNAERPLDRDLPLTIDPTGVHVRQDGPTSYMVGATPDPDPAVDPDDFTMDHSLWQDHVWPVIATRIPQFEAIRVVTEWAGHYAYNTLDQNAVLGPHPDLRNFLFLNGFSGHGLQQSPAMGRGIAEWITFGGYRSLDLTPFHYERILAGQAFDERAVI